MNYIDNAERNLGIEWPVNDGIAKLFTIPRQDIDDESNEPDAWELIFIDNGGVRRHETLIDCAYGRFDKLSDEDEKLLKTCPDKYVVDDLMEYIG